MIEFIRFCIGHHHRSIAKRLRADMLDHIPGTLGWDALRFKADIREMIAESFDGLEARRRVVELAVTYGVTVDTAKRYHRKYGGGAAAVIETKLRGGVAP